MSSTQRGSATASKMAAAAAGRPIRTQPRRPRPSTAATSRASPESAKLRATDATTPRHRAQVARCGITAARAPASRAPSASAASVVSSRHSGVSLVDRAERSLQRGPPGTDLAETRLGWRPVGWRRAGELAPHPAAPPVGHRAIGRPQLTEELLKGKSGRLARVDQLVGLDVAVLVE